MEPENDWNMMVTKRNLLSKGLLFRFHVKLQGCFRVFDWHSKLLCRQNVQWVPIALQALDWRSRNEKYSLATWRTFASDGAVCYEHLPIIQVITIVAIRCFTIFSTCKCQLCGSLRSSIHRDAKSHDRSVARRPPSKEGGRHAWCYHHSFSEGNEGTGEQLMANRVTVTNGNYLNCKKGQMLVRNTFQHWYYIIGVFMVCIDIMFFWGVQQSSETVLLVAGWITVSHKNTYYMHHCLNTLQIFHPIRKDSS